jgi:hypothetical protein
MSEVSIKDMQFMTNGCQEEARRRYVANEVIDKLVEQFRLSGLPDLPALWIHWDDCDSDCRTFWIHFRNPSTLLPHHVYAISRQLRRSKAAILKWIDEKTPYTGEWILRSSPQKTYKVLYGRKYAESYKDDTWIYTLCLYGG